MRVPTAAGRFLAGLLLAAAAAEAAPLPVAVDDSLLAAAREAHWSGESERAVPVFRDRLAGHPDDRATRRSLADALAWSGSAAEAIPHYERLLAGSPADRDLLLGRARALEWTGREEEAFDAYRRIEKTGGSGEIRDAVDRLRHRVDPLYRGEAELLHDSARITAYRSGAEQRLLGTGLAQLRLRLGFERIADDRAESLGRTATVSAIRIFPGGREASLEAGWISHDGGGDHPRLRVGLRGRPARRLSAGFEVAYGDRAYDLRSLDAARAGIRGLEASGTFYWTLSPSAGLWGAARGGALDDGNSWRSAALSLDRSLGLGLTGSLAGRGIGYARDRRTYYSPGGEWDLSAGLREMVRIGAAGRLWIGGRIGAIGNEEGRGRTWASEAGGTVRLGRLTGAASFAYSASRRESTYLSRTGTLALRWSP